MSLRIKLNQIIKDLNGQVFTFNELEHFCHREGYKISNGERQLRKSKSPDIQAVYNEKKTAIIGYKFKPSFDVVEWNKQFPQKVRVNQQQLL